MLYYDQKDEEWYQYIYSAIILYFISWAKLGSAQPRSGQIRLDLK